jgi:beta-hydroxylase
MTSYPLIAFAGVYGGSFAYLYSRCNDHLPFHKYLSNHVFWYAPLNFLFTFFTVGRPKPVFSTDTVPGLDKIKENYPLIRGEAKAMLDSGVFQRPPALDEPGYNTFEKGGYRTYRLKWYTKECGSAAKRMCPGTCTVLDSIPAIRSAMFTVLPPGGRLGRHHDPIASSLRYHLGLVTPNSDKCALTLDGVEYPWLDGEELLFDQTYLHTAVNRTEVPRVILFCDVEKTTLHGFIKPLAEGINSALVAKLVGANDKGKLSWLSAAYKPIYKVRSYVKEKIKPRSIVAYNVIKFASLAALVALPFVLFNLVSLAFGH